MNSKQAPQQKSTAAIAAMMARDAQLDDADAYGEFLCSLAVPDGQRPTTDASWLPSLSGRMLLVLLARETGGNLMQVRGEINDRYCAAYAAQIADRVPDILAEIEAERRDELLRVRAEHGSMFVRLGGAA